MLETGPPGVKMILLGEAGVGKTSIIKRFLNNKFDDKETSSLTMTYAGKIINFGDKEISLDIWDTIGQERFRSLSSLFLKNANIIVLVYSIISKESFEALDYWYNLYKELYGSDVVLGVAGNKSDLFLKEEVPEEKGREYAQDHDAIFSLLSAKESKVGIEKFVNNLVEAYLDKNKSIKNKNSNEKIIRLSSTNNINNSKGGNSGCCSGGKNKAMVKKYESLLKENNGYLYSIFLGDNRVGKTSIIKRLEGKEFSRDEEHTDNLNESVLFCKNKTMNIKMKIFDINNEKSKSKKIAEIITKSKIYFLVYDIKSKKGLETLKYWIGVIKNSKEDIKSTENYLIIIIGNKNDKSNKNEEENEENDGNEGNIINEREEKKYINEGRDLALQNKGIFKITSAMENSGLEDLIKEAIDCYLNLP
jgi:small GTP-binding protein